MYRSVLTRILILVSFGWCAFGCAGVARVSFFDGTCGSEFDQCMERCQSRADSSPCEMDCRFKGKLCSRRQALASSSGRPSPQLGLRDHVELVDFSAYTPLVSDGLTMVLSPNVRRDPQKSQSADQSYSHLLPPGASIDIDMTLPEDLESAELVLRHAPVGVKSPCLVTISMGKEVLASRYNPPRKAKGRVTLDRWDVSIPVARAKPENGRKKVKLFILNNAVAGSQDEYRITSIELYYQVPATGTEE